MSDSAFKEMVRFIKDLKLRNQRNAWLQLECNRLLKLAGEE
jgi:hypothetical protein